MTAFERRVAVMQNLLYRERGHHRSFSLVPSSPAPAGSSNAAPEPRLEAGAQRTLEGVGSRPSLGVGSGREAGLSHPSPLRCRAPASTTPRSDVMAQEGLNYRVHLVGHLELIEVARPHGPAIDHRR